MKIVISYCNFSVLATECTNTCKDRNGFSLAIQAFLSCYEISVPKKAVFNKYDMLKFCNEWKKHWDKLKFVTQK